VTEATEVRNVLAATGTVADTGGVSLTHRLNALERNDRRVTDVTKVTEEDREKVRELAEHTNRCQNNEPPVFEITEDGGVISARDGKPVETVTATLAEEFYWMEVEWGAPDLIHDEDQEAFFTRDGHLAVSRERVNLPHLLGKSRWEQPGGGGGVRPNAQV